MKFKIYGLLALGLIINLISPKASAQSAPQLNYITRLYVNILGRNPDPNGFAHIAAAAKNGTSCAQIAAGFLGSQEFENDNNSLTNQYFVIRMYEGLLNRYPDANGYSAYTNFLLQNPLRLGHPRSYLVNVFLQSPEFNNVCRASGFTNGAGAFTDVGTIDFL